jgi:hypothetical protein
MEEIDELSAFNAFVTLHKPQLLLSGVPEHFWLILHKKLTKEIFDAGILSSLETERMMNIIYIFF